MRIAFLNAIHSLSRRAPLEIIVILAMMIFLTGCRDSKFKYAPVSGHILLDGQPVSNARVVFMPRSDREDGEAGPYSNGETDAEGRYQLTSVAEKPRNGAVVGFHRVIVSTRKAHLDPDVMDREIVDFPESIPSLYTNYRKTPLEFIVPAEGTETADFALESKKKRP